MFTIEIIGRLFLATILGGVIGFEREKFGKEAGMRTHALVALASALFTIVSKYGFDGENVDPSRVASNLVVGIGFLGAGIILKQENRVKGLTTAAGLWVVAALGIIVGLGWYWLAMITTILVYIVLLFTGLVPEAVKPKEERGK